jgi:galactose mutarotase-like enzyme
LPEYRIQHDTDKYPILEMSEENGTATSWVKLCPERGGIALAYGVDGKELFYLDKETFWDHDANIRGGSPILFPISGRLDEGRYEWDCRTFEMKNHGFARDTPWKVARTNVDDGASVTLQLNSSMDTFRKYPFEFELRFTYLLKDSRLHIFQEYENLSHVPMPMYPGFHPYFAVDSKKVAFETDAGVFLDFIGGERKPFPGTVDFSEQVDIALLDASKNEISFRPSENVKIRLTYGPEFKYVVLWSIPDKPFVCVEPWMGLPNELNAQKELVFVQPKETLRTEFVIEAVPC